jgi:hypothetical protein
MVLAEVERFIFRDGGTDIVDLTLVSDRFVEDDGTLVEGPAESLAGRQGFVTVLGNEQPSLIGNFTVANLNTLSAFGATATGLGVIGGLLQGAPLFGTTFAPETLEDDFLMIVALNEPFITSLTDGEPPPVGEPLLEVFLQLFGNEGDGFIAETVIGVNGSALFTSLVDLFPIVTLDTSATMVIFGDEGPGYSGSTFDPDDDDFLAILGYYGEAVGPFGTAQNLRTESFIE